MLLLALSALVALVAVGLLLTFRASPKTVTVAEVKTESGSGSAGGRSLTVSGYVVAHHKIAVGAKVMGRVAWIGVEKGDKVEQGQVLVRLEDEEFRAQVEQARANLAAAQARLDQLRAGSRPQEKLKDRAGVIQAEANCATPRPSTSASKNSTSSGVASKAELDRATHAARHRRARCSKRPARRARMTDIGPRDEEIRAAEAQVQQMKAALDYAETQLASTEIKAPVAGTVLQRIVERGEMVTPSAFGESGARTSVVALADLNDLQIELDISQADFARLKMGQRAEIIPEAYPEPALLGVHRRDRAGSEPRQGDRAGQSQSRKSRRAVAPRDERAREFPGRRKARRHAGGESAACSCRRRRSSAKTARFRLRRQRQQSRAARHPSRRRDRRFLLCARRFERRRDGRHRRRGQLRDGRPSKDQPMSDDARGAVEHQLYSSSQE